MGDHRGTGIVDGRVARQLDGDIRDGEGLGDLHDSAEHQLRLHGRQGDVPQLLPAVLDAVQDTGLIEGLVHSLKARDEAEEAGAQAQPQLHHDQHGQDVFLGLHPDDGFVDDVHLQQDAVQEAVAVAGEDDLPDHISIAADTGGIEDQGQEGPELAGELIDDPGEEQAHQIADGAGDHGEEQGVLQRHHEQVIVDEQPDIVGPAGELRPLQHIEIRDAQDHGGQHLQDREAAWLHQNHKSNLH